MNEDDEKKIVEMLFLKLKAIIEDTRTEDELSLIKRKWLFGRVIAIEKLSLGGYKKEIVPVLIKLNKKDESFKIDNLLNCLLFYNSFPNLFEKSFHINDKLLSYSHYELLMNVKDDDERLMLERLANKYDWDINALSNQIKNHLDLR